MTPTDSKQVEEIVSRILYPYAKKEHHIPRCDTDEGIKFYALIEALLAERKVAEELRKDNEAIRKLIPIENCEAIQDENKKLQALLVLAEEGLKKIADKEIVFPDYDWSDWNGHDAQREAKNLIGQFAQLILNKLKLHKGESGG